MDLFKINGKTYLATQYKVGKDQIWKEGSGRDANDGVWYGSVLGFYTNVNMTLVFKTKEELRNFIKDTKRNNISLTFYDPELMSERTRDFYIGNYQIGIKGFYDGGSEQYFDTLTFDLVAKRPD